MSIEALNWAIKLEDPDMTCAKKFVLVVLGNYCNENGFSYPSSKKLEEITTMDRKTILKALTELEDDGLITDTGKRCGATKQVRVFTLNINSPKNGTIPNFPENSPKFPGEQSQNWDTDTKEKPLKNHQKGDSEESPPLKAPKKEKQRMQIPTLGEVQAKANEIQLSALQAEKFFNYHTARGWMMGRSPMKDWVAALRTWKLNAAEFAKERPPQDGKIRPSWEEGRAEQERRHALRREGK